MYKIPLSDIKQKILAGGKLSAEQLELKLKAKINELSASISEEGAAHIIANELGVELVSLSKEEAENKKKYMPACATSLR